MPWLKGNTAPEQQAMTQKIPPEMFRVIEWEVEPASPHSLGQTPHHHQGSVFQ